MKVPYEIHHGRCERVLSQYPDNTFDSCVTDPPYGLSFMNKHWDYDVPSVEIWREILRVMKPGAHLLAFGGTRTFHRMAVNIEDAGFEIRDTLMWVYGSGFPKSLDVSKALDKEVGAEREVIGVKPGHEGFANRGNMSSVQSFKGTLGDKGGFARPWMDDPEKVERYHQATAPSSDSAKQWDGWGTALKPAWEPIIMARKPLEGTVAQNVTKWGTGGLNIDASRVKINEEVDDPRLGGKGNWKTDKAAKNVYNGGYRGNEISSSSKGRWPANVLHDGSDEVVSMFPDSDGQQGDVLGTEPSRTGDNGIYGKYDRVNGFVSREDSGSAARFFYCAKTSREDREEGCHKLNKKILAQGNQAQAQAQRGELDHAGNSGMNTVHKLHNNHPTVKPTELMRYLVKLVTPRGATCLDPFMGSGSTGKAAILEHINFIGIEDNEEYLPIAESRLRFACNNQSNQLRLL